MGGDGAPSFEWDPPASILYRMGVLSGQLAQDSHPEQGGGGGARAASRSGCPTRSRAPIRRQTKKAGANRRDLPTKHCCCGAGGGNGGDDVPHPPSCPATAAAAAVVREADAPRSYV